MNELFSVTYWPGGGQPIPAVDVPDRVDRRGEWLDVVRSWRSHPEAIPEEFHLRECQDVDLDDLDAVCEMVRRYGSPVPRRGGTDDLPANADRAIERWAGRHGRAFRKGIEPPGKPLGTWVHVDEVMYRLRVIRQLSAHAVAYRLGNYVSEAWPDEAQKRNADSIRIMRRGEANAPADGSPAFRDATDIAAWQDFVRYTDLALRPFHVRVWVDLGDRDYDIGIPRPTLYEAAVLQIVNDLAEDVDYRDCPHCHRTFGRQVGRAMHGQNRRTGVTYCSPSCASAARVRTYRARKRAEKKG